MVDYEGVLATASPEEEIILTAGLIYQSTSQPWFKCKEIAKNIISKSDSEIMVKDTFSAKEGAAEVITQLKANEFFTGILTSDCFKRTVECMDILGVTNLLDFIITPLKVKQGNLTPYMIERVCEELQISPNELAVVGDSTMDLKMAKSIGSVAIGLVTYEGSREVLCKEADFLIKSLYDIKISN